MERQAFNFKIQGFAADLLKISMNKLRPHLPLFKAKYVLTVHDEIVLECPKTYSEPCVAKVQEVMENCVRLSVPIIAECGIVENYGE